MHQSIKNVALSLFSLSLGFHAQLRAEEAPSSLSLMFYNTYNLFDTEHDAGKDDWTFLPKNFPGKQDECAKITDAHYRQECLESDWTPQHLNVKLGQLEKAVRAATNDQLPDMLGLSEVENENVVGMLAKKLGYETFVMTKSPDQRGIDVALLYRNSTKLRFEGMVELKITDPAVGKATRNILEAKFSVNGETLYVYVNHWPSQAAPAPARMAAAKVLLEQTTKRQAEGAFTIAMGDFNTTDQDYPHPFKALLTDRQNRNQLKEVHDLFFASNASQDVKRGLPAGTYFYMPRMSWDRLDRFFVSTNLSNKSSRLSVDAASYRILAPDLIRTSFTYNDPSYFNYGTTVTNTPLRADINARTAANAGYSDHFPIFVKLNIPQ